MIHTRKDNSSNNNDRKLILVKNKRGKTVGIPTKQRALILQGGGALGAYEIGVLQSIYEHLAKDIGIDKKAGRAESESLFDIVAGVSIGAINAVFLVDYVLKHNNSWNNSLLSLENFWDNFIANTFADRKTAKIDYPIKTSFEMNQPRLLLVGVDVKDCSTAVTFDSYPSYSITCDVCGQDFKENDSLVSHMKTNHIKVLVYPLKKSGGSSSSLSTTLSDSDADVSKLRTIFESNDNRLWNSVYGDAATEEQKHVVCYDGIGEDQLMASCLFPYSNYHPTMYDLVTKEKRTFWDGAFLSNTPLRELLQRHRDFWENYFKDNNIDWDEFGLETKEAEGRKKPDKELPKVPDLEIFIVNLYPSLETLDELIPSDRDKIMDRMSDITFHDRPNYDEKVADTVTDYIDLSRELIVLAKQKGATDDEIKRILTMEGESKRRDIRQKRRYGSLLEGRFRVKVHRIQRQDDGDTIFGKASDFSYTTVKNLKKIGKEETDKWFESNSYVIS